MSGLEQLRTGILAAIDHSSDRNRTPALPGGFASNVAHRANNLVKEPSNGPSVRIANHHEAGVPFPIAETFAITASVKRMIGSELAIAMITTTKIGSATFTFPT